MKRPELHKIELKTFPLGGVSMTMGKNQWDVMLDEAYKMGCTLIELDDDENFIAAYQKPE